MTALFATYVVADWSARSAPSPARPSKDAIWVGVARGGEDGAEAIYLRTRAAALEWLTALLRNEIDAGRRVLIGFDFPFGYPAGAAGRITGAPDARALWRWLAGAVDDDAQNRNNRFDVAARMNRKFDGAGPFWGAPGGVDMTDLPARASARFGDDHPPERRACEIAAPSAKSVWQIMYAGSVGSQVILGLPVLERLCEALGDDIAVWPFDTGFETPEAPLALVEIYPSLFVVPSDARGDEAPDALQVRATASAYRDFDRKGVLPEMFRAPNISDAHRSAVEREEAWILGLGHPAMADAARPGAVRCDA